MKTLLISALGIAVLLGGLAGCSSTQVVPAAGRTAAAKLERGGKVYIATPDNGNYGGKTYARSGAAVAATLDAAFARFADGTVVGPNDPSTTSIVEAAKAKGCSYAVIPKITRWEDRATEWSGISDKMGFFVKVVRVADGQEIAASDVIGKSSWFTMGGDHPEDLLRAPVEAFVAQLY